MTFHNITQEKSDLISAQVETFYSANGGGGSQLSIEHSVQISGIIVSVMICPNVLVDEEGLSLDKAQLLSINTPVLCLEDTLCWKSN